MFISCVYLHARGDTHSERGGIRDGLFVCCRSLAHASRHPKIFVIICDGDGMGHMVFIRLYDCGDRYSNASIALFDVKRTHIMLGVLARYSRA